MGRAEYLNAGSVVSTDGVDGLHLTAESEKNSEPRPTYGSVAPKGDHRCGVSRPGRVAWAGIAPKLRQSRFN
jgi:hypothetical protein